MHRSILVSFALFCLISISFGQEEEGYWTIRKLQYGAYGAEVPRPNSNCDRSTSRVCDIFIKIFIDDELVYETEVTHHTPEAELEVDFQSQLVRKDSKVRFEMWDEDEEIYETEAIAENSDLLLNKTFTVGELVNKDSLKIYAGLRAQSGDRPDNFIEIYDSTWSMD